MKYDKLDNKSHVIVLDDDEIASLVAVLNSCNLMERRVFNKLKTTIEEENHEIFGK